ncbi:hypothetical protein [Burkholderia cepacia]|uniref:hypothetical protein n=1 Tax=Burkholderia cepacia TaxID=292 RepID=UPI002AB5FCB4|nr:hypothetical protein [Burkholderia cepacia]
MPIERLVKFYRTWKLKAIIPRCLVKIDLPYCLHPLAAPLRWADGQPTAISP